VDMAVAGGEYNYGGGHGGGYEDTAEEVAANFIAEIYEFELYTFERQ